MPVTPVTSVLAAGLTPLFTPLTAPATTAKASQDWARAYCAYAFAGGVVAAKTREAVLGSALANAFRPELAGGGPALFIQALAAYWVGMPIPEMSGVATAFIPLNVNVNNPQPEGISPADQARGLALVIAGLTLGAVKVTVPPGVIVPLL